MPTREELFAAMQLIKGYCKSRDECHMIAQAATKDCCPFFTQFGSTWCALRNDPPCAWPDTLFYTPGSTDHRGLVAIDENGFCCRAKRREGNE